MPIDDFFENFFSDILTDVQTKTIVRNSIIKSKVFKRQFELVLHRDNKYNCMLSFATFSFKDKISTQSNHS